MWLRVLSVLPPGRLSPQHVLVAEELGLLEETVTAAHAQFRCQPIRGLYESWPIRGFMTNQRASWPNRGFMTNRSASWPNRGLHDQSEVFMTNERPVSSKYNNINVMLRVQFPGGVVTREMFRSVGWFKQITFRYISNTYLLIYTYFVEMMRKECLVDTRYLQLRRCLIFLI